MKINLEQKNQKGTLKTIKKNTWNHEKPTFEPWKTIKNGPGTIKNQPVTLKKPQKPTCDHEKPICNWKTKKTNLELYMVVMGGYRWLQVVTGNPQEEVMIFRDTQTDTSS